MSIAKFTSKVIGDKRRWREYKARTRQLPENYRAADGTPIRAVVGEDPVEFIEAFLRNYPEGQWRSRERERLISAIERAAGEDTGKGETV